VKERKLSGQVLKNRTGTLRRKINYQLRETPTEVSASVGVQLSYAAVHEYGFDGIVTVKEHLRTITQAFGRPIAPVHVHRGAHQRHMKLPERSFLRSSLRENAPSIREAARRRGAGAASHEQRERSSPRCSRACRRPPASSRRAARSALGRRAAEQQPAASRWRASRRALRVPRRRKWKLHAELYLYVHAANTSRRRRRAAQHARRRGDRPRSPGPPTTSRRSAGS
jgi:phage gpG-like protein